MHFKKEDTLVSKGIAILFLICYHCFSSTERLAGVDVNFFPLPKGAAMYIANAMNVCVGMFIFLTAYGLTISAKLREQSYALSGKTLAKMSLGRYIKVLGTFLIPFLICEIVCALIGYNAYGAGKLAWIAEATLDFLGLSKFFDTPNLCGTWWYMSLNTFAVFSFPLFIFLYKKIDFLIIPLFAMALLLGVSEPTNMHKFMLAIPIAIVFADYDLFYKIKMWKEEKKFLSVCRDLLILAVFLVLVYLRSSKWGGQHLKLIISSVTPAPMIYLGYRVLYRSKIVKRVLVFIGKHSSNIFFVHTFIRWVWLKDFTYSLKYAVLIFLFVSGSSLLISLAIEGIKKITHYEKAVTFVRDKLLLKIG